MSAREKFVRTTRTPAGSTIDHPIHYNAHPSGVECIDIVEHFNFNVGSAMKYLWRAGMKDATIDDLKKAAWYVAREIARVERSANPQEVPSASKAASRAPNPRHTVTPARSGARASDRKTAGGRR